MINLLLTRLHRGRPGFPTLPYFGPITITQLGPYMFAIARIRRYRIDAAYVNAYLKQRAGGATVPEAIAVAKANARARGGEASATARRQAKVREREAKMKGSSLLTKLMPTPKRGVGEAARKQAEEYGVKP